MADNDEEDEVPPLEEVHKCPEGAPGWVVTFGDMMSLLLTFFILLLSFAQMTIVKYKLFTGSVMEAFGIQEATPLFNRPQGRSIIKTKFSSPFHSRTLLNGMKSSTERHANRTPSGRVDIEVFEDYRGIVVTVGEDEMFEPGQASLRPAIWPFLDDVLGTATENGAQIQVEAHTDNRPMRSARFQSNDYLSAGRSVAVVRYFLGVDNELHPERLEAVAYGEHRPKVVNMNEAGMKKNRRVELIFYGIPKDYRQD